MMSWTLVFLIYTAHGAVHRDTRRFKSWACFDAYLEVRIR